MSVRLFEEFQKKNFSVKVGGIKLKGGGDDEEICIAIPLKVSSGQQKPKELDENFIRVIEYEYAVRYLEQMGIESNPKNIQNLLKSNPLSSCELSSGWNNSGSLADVLYIYPNRKKRFTFDTNREQINKKKEEDVLRSSQKSRTFHSTREHEADKLS